MEHDVFSVLSLPGQPPETLTAEDDCFQRSVVASGPPFTCTDKDLCRYEATQPAHSEKFIFSINHQNILPLTPMYCS